MSFLRDSWHPCRESPFEFLDVAAVVLSGHSLQLEPLDATRTALGNDSMQTEHHT